MTRDYLSVDDLTPDELAHVIELAATLKSDRTLQTDALPGRPWR